MNNEELLDKFCEFFEVDKLLLKNKKRKREIVDIRQLYCYVGYLYFGKTITSLAETLGGRDHTTAVHGVAKIKKLIETRNYEICSKFNSLKEYLGISDERINGVVTTEAYLLIHKENKKLKEDYDSLLEDYLKIKRKYRELKNQLVS